MGHWPQPTLTHPTRRTCAAYSTASVYGPYQHPLPKKGDCNSALLLSLFSFPSFQAWVSFRHHSYSFLFFCLLQVAFPIHLLWPSPHMSLPHSMLAGLLHESALKLSISTSLCLAGWLCLPSPSLSWSLTLIILLHTGSLHHIIPNYLHISGSALRSYLAQLRSGPSFMSICTMLLKF